MRNEQEIIKKVENIIDLLKEKEERITFKAVAKELGVSTTYLYYYSNAIAKIRIAIQEENYVAKRKEQHRHQVFLQVKVAVERLRVKREPLTVTAIAKETGKERTTLLLYPEIMSYIRLALTENVGGVASSRFSQEVGLDSNS
jgi:AraC-like DNA-binding protein